MQHLTLARFAKNGAYLRDDAGAEVLLPVRYLSAEMTLGALVWAFIYTDSEDRIVAITDEPKAFLGDIVALKVVALAHNGIYLDLGIPKDLFMPSKNPRAFQIGQKVVVKIAQDAQNRLIARANVADFLRPLKRKIDRNIEILPFKMTQIGLNCVVNGEYFGVLHASDINCVLELGEKYRGTIKKVRTDGKIDIAMSVDLKDLKEKILCEIRENGELKASFKTNSEEIFRLFGASKKSFKTAINALVRENKIMFEKDSFKSK